MGGSPFLAGEVTLLCCPHCGPHDSAGRGMATGTRGGCRVGLKLMELEEWVKVGVGTQVDSAAGDQGFAARFWVRSPGHHRQRLA